MHKASNASQQVGILLPSLLSDPKPGVCPSFGLASQTQSAGHRFLLKPTKPVIWPRGDDDLAMSERIPTSLKLGISQDS